jgi:hypothetical protein
MALFGSLGKRKFGQVFAQLAPKGSKHEGLVWAKCNLPSQNHLPIQGVQIRATSGGTLPSLSTPPTRDPHRGLIPSRGAPPGPPPWICAGRSKQPSCARRSKQPGCVMCLEEPFAPGSRIHRRLGATRIRSRWPPPFAGLCLGSAVRARPPSASDSRQVQGGHIVTIHTKSCSKVDVNVIHN